ncbi:MAG: hypothetical protein HRT98_04395 [Mycoplasmatales bacterium]|nr:hypothetical protein [Mycoplasmatales bacterium]
MADKPDMILMQQKNKHGIYVYRDKATGEIVYIGKDSKMNVHNRYFGHSQKDSKNKKHPIDIEIQKHPEKYIYEQFLFCDSYNLEAIEKTLIMFWKPKFNQVFNKKKKK